MMLRVPLFLVRKTTGTILPSVNFKYAVSPLSYIRAAASMSYARPNFDDIFGGRVFVPSDNEAEIGNTGLEPVSAVNLDLMGEHYFGTVGVITVGVFLQTLR